MLNVQDSEVEDLLYRLTFLEADFIGATLSKAETQPEKRIGQTLLARTVTEMVHGPQALQSVQGSTSAFFSVDCEQICAMTRDEFVRHFEHTKVVEVPLPTEGSFQLNYSSLVTLSGLRKTKGDAKRVI